MAHMSPRDLSATHGAVLTASPARVLCLADVRLRLELILNGLFEARIAVAAAEPPAPVSWLARLAGHAADSNREVPAGTDGIRVFLPATWDASAGADLAFPPTSCLRSRRRHVLQGAARRSFSGSATTTSGIGFSSRMATALTSGSSANTRARARPARGTT